MGCAVPVQTCASVVRLLSPFVRRLAHLTRSLLQMPRRYRIGEFTITLPAEHALWLYQAEHPHYDRFLPHLTRFVKAHEGIIDVGANVGDSLAAMVNANPAPTFLCVEADETFYRYLTENISAIKARRGDVQIHPVKCLVGKQVVSARLEGKQGTKHAVMTGDGSVTSRPLDEIVATTPGVPRIRVIKTDVDGFDYDVIDSAIPLIIKDKPLIFFEYDCSTEMQRAGFERMLSSLEAHGYCDWAVFDNFGQLVLRTDALGVVRQLVDYAWKQKQGASTRTVYYFDVLACHADDKDLVAEVLASY